MNQNRSIQDIIPPARSRPIRPSITPVAGGDSEPPMSKPPESIRVNSKRPSGMPSFLIVAGAAVLLLGIGIAVMSTIFYHAYVMVTPHSFPATLDTTLDITSGAGAVSYQKIEASDTATKKVPATGSQHVENHASGTIVIHNAYTTSSQRLITNTRFATKDGKVFRIHAPVVIPGYTMKAGVKVPGTVEVVAYADEAGEKYNIPVSDFTIPGLKGSKQYDLMYAKSKTAMSGGYVGEQAVVDPTLRASTVEGLKADLDRSLRAKIYASEPEGTVIFDDLITISYLESPDIAEDNEAVISVSASAATPAIAEGALGSFVGSASGISYQGSLHIENPNELNVSLTGAESLGSDIPLKMALSGSVNLVADFDSASLTKDLAGKSKKQIKDVLPDYPAIETIDVKIYPFWRGGIPSDLSKLKVEVAGQSTGDTQGS